MSLTISAVGDVSLGDHPVCVGHGVRTAFKKRPDEIFREVRKVISSSDVAIANLETVVSDKGLKKFWLPSYEMRGDPKALRYVKEAGFNVLGVANNHAFQHGRAAFFDMVEQIQKNELPVIGIDEESGKTRVHELEHDGRTTAIVAFSIRPEEWTKDQPAYSYRANHTALVEEVKRLRQQYDGFLICSLHWGLEFLDYPAPHQVQLGRDLVDAGVDVLFGHHSHVLQPVERYGRGLIFYSLGNFVFDLWQDSTKLTGVATVTLEEGMPPSFAFCPMVIGHDYVLRVASEQESATITRIMSSPVTASAASHQSAEDQYVSEYKAARKRFRLSSYRYFLRNIYRYPIHFLIQSLGRTALRRMTGN